MTLDTNTRCGTVDQRIAALAIRQGGVVASWQLRQAGIGRTSVHRRIADGRLERIAPHAYLVTQSARSLDTRARRGLALVHAGPGLAGLARGTAAAHLGLLDRGDGSIHLVVDRHVNDLHAHRIVYHRAVHLDPEDLAVVADEPTTTVTRTIVDLGFDHSRYQVARAMCAARDRDRLDRNAIELLLGDRHGRPGTVEVRAALDLIDEGCNGTRGRGEDYLLEGVLLSRRVPIPHVCNRRALGIAGIEPDLAWLDVGLVVFADGGPHRWEDVLVKDQLEQSTLEQHGMVVMRVPNRRIWRNRAAVIREIELAYEECRRSRRAAGAWRMS